MRPRRWDRSVRGRSAPVIAIALPPLRDRRDDVPTLVAHFLETRPVGRGPFAVDPAVLAVLCGYDWPGNVRQLRNNVERIMILASGEPTSEITAAMLPKA